MGRGFSAMKAAILLTTTAFLAGAGARADDGWRWTASIEHGGQPGGWVQVREHAVEGTHLRLAADLGVRHVDGVRIGAVKAHGDRGRWALALATYALDGRTLLTQPVAFNGATLGPGPLRTTTKLTHFLQFDTSWQRRLASFEKGGGLWGGAGLTFVLLDFTLDGTVAPGSAGNETHEMFYVQELPVPMLGLHLRYPLLHGLSLVAAADAGRLPGVDSLRHEGGLVRLWQTDTDASAGVTDTFSSGWRVTLAAFVRDYAQQERSREDGNRIHLRERGLSLGFTHAF